MKWFYESNGQAHGPILEAELRRLRDTDKLSDDSLVWKEGMADWAPFKSIQADFHRAAHVREATGAPESRLPTLSHPAPATSNTQGSITQQKADFHHLPAHEPHSLASDHRGALDWEKVPKTNLAAAFVSALQNTLFHTRQTGQELGHPGDWKLPLAFLSLGEMVGTLLMFATVSMLPATNSQLAAMTKRMVGLQSGGVGLVALLLSSLSMLPISILVKSALLHVCLKIFGGSRASFSTTFRTLCYALGSSAVLWLIPLISVATATVTGETAVVDFAMALAMVSVLLWSIWVTIGCLAASHGMSTFKAALAIFLPPFLTFTLFFFILARSFDS